MEHIIYFGISILFFALAAICNAIMDVCVHHYYKSIFKKRCKTQKCTYWWNESESWKSKYVDRDVDKGRVKWHFLGITFNKPVQFCDAWHFFKAIMIFMLAFSVMFHREIIFTGNIYIDFFIQLTAYGLAWNLTFNLFYNKVLETKE